MSMVWYTGSDGTGALTTGSVNTTYYAKLSFKGEDVRSVYIDWGDGISNKKSEANYQWVQYTEPKNTDIVSHIYTQSGTFSPIVQTVNSQGIMSRYYGSGSTSDDVSPYTSNTNINKAIIKDSSATGIMRIENTTVKSGIDNSAFDKNGASGLYMYIPPTITLDELKTLGSIKLTLDLVITDSLVNTGSTSATFNLSQAGGGSSLQTLQATVLLDGVGATQSGIFNLLLSGGSGNVPLNGDFNARCARVVGVRYDNCKIENATYAQNDIFNRLKIFILTEAGYEGSSYDGGTTYYPVTYVSAGAPYKSMDDTQRNVLLDFSQSRAAASNINISAYRFDWGKAWFNPMYRWAEIGYASSPSQPYRLTDNTKITGSVMPVSYTYMPRPSITKGTDVTCVQYRTTPGGGSTVNYAAGLGGLNNTCAQFAGDDASYASYIKGCFLDDEFNYWFISTQGRYRATGGGGVVPRGKANQFITAQFGLDDLGKFYDQYHFVRLTADPATTGSNGTYLNVSPSIQNQPWVLRVYGRFTDWDSEEGAIKSNIDNLAMIDNSGSKYNAGGSAGIGGYPLASLNNTQPTDISGATVSGATDYILCIFDAKTNKLFLNCSNNTQGVTQEDADINVANLTPAMTRTSIVGVSYLRVNNPNTFEQSVEWIPMEYNDETRVEREYRDTTNDKYITSGASFARSGYLSYNMPADWSACTVTQLCGGRYGVDNKVSWTGSLNSMEKLISGKVISREAQDTTNIGSNAKWGYSFKIANVGTGFDDYIPADIGAFKYVLQLADSTGGSAGDNADMIGVSRWVAKTSSGILQDGFNQDSSGNNDIYFHDGDGTVASSNGWDTTATGTDWIVRPVNIYDVITGVNKVYYVSGSDTRIQPMMNGFVGGYADKFDNLYNLRGTYDAFFPSQGTPTVAGTDWVNDDKYVLRIAVSGVTGIPEYDGLYTGGTSPERTNGTCPELWNIFDATQNNVGIIKEVDDSAWNLNSLPLTSDISMSRSSTMYTAITRKGKVYVSKTGIGLQTISFSSVAMGDSKSSTAFDDSDEYSTYGQLRIIRKLQSSAGDAYWDEPQKDGTYIRIFGVLSDVSETLGVGGSRTVMGYNFTLTIKEIALLDASGEMMTNPYPLGGIEDERSYK